MGKSGEIFGEDFSTCQESTKNFGANFGATFGASFGANFGNFATFFGNFVQQKGGANTLFSLSILVARRAKTYFVLSACPSCQGILSVWKRRP